MMTGSTLNASRSRVSNRVDWTEKSKARASSEVLHGLRGIGAREEGPGKRLK